MIDRRIHVFGASGSGTTTLGRSLAERLGIPHFDTDDYFWVKTTPIPFTVKTDITGRVARLRADLLKHPDWVLSGSLCDWGDSVIPLFTLAVFLWIPAGIRLKRIREREIERYGVEALSPGGWFHQNHMEFMTYAASYDSGGLDIRSRQLHEQWMRSLPCRLLRIEEPLSTQEQIATIEHELAFMESTQVCGQPGN
jgi:adenylate kinase family enzyme